MFCRNEEKRSLLLKTLQDEATQNDGQVPRTLVFVSTKRNADDIQSFLNYKGYASIAVHGDKTQRMRESALDQFRSGKRDILVATDVAARGLDVSNIKLVINFDMANTIEDHVHRIGRTGRANSFGKSISFFTNDDSSLAPKLASLMHQCKQKVDPKLLQIVPSEENKNRFQYRNKGFNMSYRNKSQRPFYNRPRKFSYGSQDSDW